VKERGIPVQETKRGQDGAFESYIKLTVTTDEYERTIAGTVFSEGRPRIIQVRDINMEFEIAPHMLFIRNTDQPGFIGRLGMITAEANLNIATLNLGRDRPGGDAICVAAFDIAVPDAVLTKIKALPQVVRANRLEF
jgi:D-3-phosphoglycerate dehydrogenase / 2-oxoglutarate reductase